VLGDHEFANKKQFLKYVLALGKQLAPTELRWQQPGSGGRECHLRNTL
jgi:hypothetical protein